MLTETHAKNALIFRSEVAMEQANFMVPVSEFYVGKIIKILADSAADERGILSDRIDGCCGCSGNCTRSF